MGKKWIVVLAVCVVIGSTGCSVSDVIQGVESGISAVIGRHMQRDKIKDVSMHEARLIALAHAQLRMEDVIFVEREKSPNADNRYLDVEFYIDNREYDYEVEITTGKIARYDYNIEEFDIPRQDIVQSN